MTVAVDKRTLVQSVVLRGDVVAERSIEVTPTARGGGSSIVTAVRVQPGDSIKAGGLVIEVAGRPLVVLAGAKPAFRDLRPGYVGDDVAQLQRALKSMGFNPGEPHGRFGAGTKAALTKYYESIGYEPLPTSDDADEQLAAASRQVKDARRALSDAEDALASASDEQKQAARKAVDRAREDLADAKRAESRLIASTGPTLPLAEYVFLPAFPARVDALTAEVGAEVTAPAVTLSSGPLKVKSVLNSGQADFVKPGMTVEGFSESVGVGFRGKVQSIGDLHTDRDNPANTGYPITVTPDGTLHKSLVGQNVRLVIRAAMSDGEVLAVPLAALFSGVDGRTYVVRLNSDGSQERISVTAGFHGDDLVAVTGSLTVGDLVVIGVQPR